jgi:hypothetical protein
MLKKILVLICLAYYAVILSGCATSGKTNTPQVLEPQAILKFSDLPIPNGFELLEKESYSFENAGVRVAVLRYKGKANIDQIINFYKEQLPMYGWTISNIIEYGERLLNLEKGNELCVINLSAKGSTVNMVISLGPKSQMNKKAVK